MITRENINEIYRKYKKAPKSVDELNIATLFDETALHHDIMIDPEENSLTIGSLDAKSPFHTLPLDRINAILGLDEWVAIVLPTSIVFLNRRGPKVTIDVKPVRQTMSNRLTSLFRTSIAC